MRFVRFISDNILFFVSIFLLFFIPLYPKMPILDIKNTWVYIRAEDFIMVLVFIVWGFLFIFKKVSLKTPLTLPILLFWVIGGISLLHGVLVIFPMIANVFSNVAFLSFLRRIEYMSLFFVAFYSIKNKRSINYIIAILPV